LLEEEGHSGIDTAIADLCDPQVIEWPVAWPGFSASNNPADAVQAQSI
jgi:hypothetical protein